MTAQEREQEQGTQQSPPPVPMHQLLASCAAADAVSKPPSGPDEDADVPRIPEALPHRPDRDAA